MMASVIRTLPLRLKVDSYDHTSPLRVTRMRALFLSDRLLKTLCPRVEKRLTKVVQFLVRPHEAPLQRGVPLRGALEVFSTGIAWEDFF